jgi:RNA polymerase primary sigma factor
MIALNPEQSIAIELTFGIESGKRHSLPEAADILKITNNHYCMVLKQGLINLFAELQANTSRRIADTSASEIIAPTKRIEDMIRIVEADTTHALQQAFNGIKAEHKQVILARYGITSEAPKTLEEIASDMNLSRERIRQIEEAALKKLSIHSKLRDFAPNS